MQSLLQLLHSIGTAKIATDNTSVSGHGCMPVKLNSWNQWLARSLRPYFTNSWSRGGYPNIQTSITFFFLKYLGIALNLFLFFWKMNFDSKLIHVKCCSAFWLFWNNWTQKCELQWTVLLFLPFFYYFKK